MEAGKGFEIEQLDDSERECSAAGAHRVDPVYSAAEAGSRRDETDRFGAAYGENQVLPVRSGQLLLPRSVHMASSVLCSADASAIHGCASGGVMAAGEKRV